MRLKKKKYNEKSETKHIKIISSRFPFQLFLYVKIIEMGYEPTFFHSEMFLFLYLVKKKNPKKQLKKVAAKIFKYIRINRFDNHL